MRQYLDIVETVLTKGKWKNNRTGIRTLTAPNMFFSHEMEEGFPLLTTKKVAFKTMAVELEGFIKGITSKRWYRDRKCKIWNEWANPRKVKLNLETYSKSNSAIIVDDKETIKIAQELENDLGPIYGYQWRRFDEIYDEDDEGHLKGVDQLADVVDKLKNNPDDRRLVVSAWNPHQLSRMALPPCHLLWVLTHIDGVLSLHWTQRSCDLMLGVPFNIASYGLLLELLCKEANLKPGNLSGTLCDCHIYENQIDVAKEQLKREPRTLPSLEHEPKKEFSIFDWEYTDTKLVNYNPHDKLDFGPVAV